MRFNLQTSFEAMQLVHGSLPAITSFIERHASVEHLGYRQEGRENPVRFDSLHGSFELVLRPGEWAVAMSGSVWAVSDEWMRENCTPAS